MKIRPAYPSGVSRRNRLVLIISCTICLLLWLLFYGSLLGWNGYTSAQAIRINELSEGHERFQRSSEPVVTEQYTLTYEIDRSQVPSLYHNDLTLKVQVNQVLAAQVIADGLVISHTHIPTGNILFTTSAADIKIAIESSGDITGLGQITTTTLLNGKGFAWSHGMDDNVGLRKQVEVLESYGWTGTFFLIAKDVDETRDQDWIVDEPYLKGKLPLGWSLGNHTWDHTCFPPFDEQTVIDGYNRLREVADASTVPDYRIISFASPCNVSAYDPFIREHRDSGSSDVQFSENGSLIPFVVDAGVAENILDEETQLPNAYAFGFELAVGRIALGTVSEDDPTVDPTHISAIDWMATQHEETGQHFWYNTLTHGDAEDLLDQFAGYIYDTYGAPGTNKAWVAPSDEIYSYLLTRERAVIVEKGVFDADGESIVIPTPSVPEEDPSSFDLYLPLLTQ
ncbi:MAG: polysaccharide deacetylase family protein [Chloroflexota bacterium]